MNTINTIPALLASPFPAAAIGWKAQSLTKDKARALAVPYIDARDVMDRLDAVLGPTNWRDEYDVLPCGAVLCRLWLRLGDEWIAKEDVGGQSDQEDTGDKMKAGFSDALKRAAVKWGIGRYLYNIPRTWIGYDAERRQLKETPQLPTWALPVSEKASTPAPRPPVAPQTKPEPRRTISEDDAENIDRLIRETGADVARFLATYHVKAIRQLSPEQGSQAIELLMRKAKRNGAAVPT